MLVKSSDTERVNRKIMVMTKLLADLLDLKKKSCAFFVYAILDEKRPA